MNRRWQRFPTCCAGRRWLACYGPYSREDLLRLASAVSCANGALDLVVTLGIIALIGGGAAFWSYGVESQRVADELDGIKSVNLPVLSKRWT